MILPDLQAYCHGQMYHPIWLVSPQAQLHTRLAHYTFVQICRT